MKTKRKKTFLKKLKFEKEMKMKKKMKKILLPY